MDLPAGKHRVELTFSPASAKAGLLITLASAAALAALGWLSRLGTRVFAIVTSVPPFAAALAGLTLHDPPQPLRDLRAPDGGPVVIHELGDAALRIDAKFEAGVTLEAASLSTPSVRSGQEVFLEFDWRRAIHAEEGLGIFVHIQPRDKGDAMNGDHVLLSGVLELDRAPSDETLRDLLPLTFPEGARGKTFDVYVGLWRIRRDGTRVRIEDKGTAVVDENRVLVATVAVR